MQRRVHVILYSKPGCGLCEEMKKELRKANCLDLYELEEVDIESDAGLFERYQHDIPVLSINGVEVFKHRLRSKDFETYLSALLGKPT